MTLSKIVFPTPPPTTNTLTPDQRTQLMRSTKKLGQILGTTPHLIDVSKSSIPLRVQLPFDLKPSYRTSVDSSSTNSSSFLERSPSPRASHKSTFSYSGSPRSKKLLRQSDTFDSWPRRQPPMLRLAAVTPSLDTIPASPPTNSPSPTSSNRRSPHSRSSFPEHFDDARSYTIRPTTAPPQFSPTSPSFTLPSLTTERRRKMERLRRKLGDNVPLDLVFPCGSDSSDYSSSEDTYTPELAPSPSPTSSASSSPSASPRKPRALISRIETTRDSIASSLSPHRAPRTFVAPAPSPTFGPGQPLKPEPKVRAPRQDRKGPAVPESQSQSQSQTQNRPQTREGKKLCAILESPNEHSAGCAQEFGLGGGGVAVGSAGSRDNSLESEWYGSDDEVQFQVQLWSTRRGYGGWL